MSIPDNLKNKLYKALELYNEDKAYENFIRKAYDDDGILIRRDVKLNDIIVAFNLKNKDFYKKYIRECNSKNNQSIINDKINKKQIYNKYTLKYYIGNYDYGSDKYNKLYIEELNENNINDNNNDEYIRQFIPDDTIERLIMQNPNVRNMIVNNHIKDEYNTEIIKKI